MYNLFSLIEHSFFVFNLKVIPVSTLRAVSVFGIKKFYTAHGTELDASAGWCLYNYFNTPKPYQVLHCSQICIFHSQNALL